MFGIVPRQRNELQLNQSNYLNIILVHLIDFYKKLSNRLTKKFLPFANNFITKYSRPKSNIIECLDCGSYHEKGTICGKCYEVVKTETEEIQKQMFKKDSFKYNYPTKEVNLKTDNH